MVSVNVKEIVIQITTAGQGYHASIGVVTSQYQDAMEMHGAAGTTALPPLLPRLLLRQSHRKRTGTLTTLVVTITGTTLEYVKAIVIKTQTAGQGWSASTQVGLGRYRDALARLEMGGIIVPIPLLSIIGLPQQIFPLPTHLNLLHQNQHLFLLFIRLSKILCATYAPTTRRHGWFEPAICVTLLIYRCIAEMTCRVCGNT